MGNTQNHLPLMGNSTSFVHWHTGEPDGGIAEQCVDLSHRNRDYTYRDYGCQNCRKFTCMKEAPFLSCDHYCLNCGRCSRNGVHSYSCECVPPYTTVDMRITMIITWVATPCNRIPPKRREVEATRNS